MASNQQDPSNRQDRAAVVPDSRLFKIKDHSSESFQVMNQLRRDGQLCDVTFRIGCETFIAHRVVVASISPYLRAMFTCGMKESSQDEIELRDIEPQAMSSLINYAYTGEVLVTIDNVQDLLPAAGILQLKELKEACCAFLSDHMDTSNCLGIKQFADLHSCPELLKKANRFIVRKFMDITSHEEFLQLPQAVLKEILENNHLHVETEMQVYLAFIAWVNYDLETRAPNAFELFESIRVSLISHEFWKQAFHSEPMFQKCQSCYAFLKGYLMGVHCQTMEPRSPFKAIYTVGGRNSQQCLATTERFISEDNRWEELPPMKQVRTAVAAGALDGKLFAIGGECETRECETRFAREGTQYLTSVEYYDPIHNVWNSVADMKYPRSFTAVCTLNGKLYAVGGETTAHCYRSVEEYNHTTNTWTSIPDMHSARSGAGCCSMGGYLYVIGGQDRAIHHSSVECYHPEDRCWRLCASMRIARSGVAAVVFGRHIYAIGGRDRHRQVYHDIVERYSPEDNAWESFPRLIHLRAWPSACVYQGQLYVMGGYDGQHRLKSVERFDVDEKKWKAVEDMNEFRAGCGSAVI